MDTAAGDCFCLGRNGAQRGHICSGLNCLAQITLKRSFYSLLEKDPIWQPQVQLLKLGQRKSGKFKKKNHKKIFAVIQKDTKPEDLFFRKHIWAAIVCQK